MSIKSKIAVFIWMLFAIGAQAQQGPVANCITNGGLEEYRSCNLQILHAGYVRNALGWDEIDSLYGAAVYCQTCIGKSPKNGFGFQYPHRGNAYTIVDFFILGQYGISERGYIRNKLRTALVPGKTYCVKFYVNNGNNSTCGISTIGAYFGDSSLDTIKYGHKRLTYLNPQVNNLVTNYITDTLQWVPITGTYVATGTEKYMVLGNFKPDAQTNYVLTATTSPGSFTFSTVSVDDISCIPIDLPAYAGPDKSCVPGDSVFIGRTPDVEINESCTWFQLPNMSIPIATVAGLYVKPQATTTYVVRQQLWCGAVKWDTVVVYKDIVGLSELQAWPNPAQDMIRLQIGNMNLKVSSGKAQIISLLGQVVREEELTFRDNGSQLSTSGLATGVYVLRLRTNVGLEITTRLMIGS